MTRTRTSLFRRPLRSKNTYLGIRGKLLVLLLAFATGPLAVIGWLVRSSTIDEQWPLLGAMITILVIMSIGFSIYISKRLTRPLNLLSEATKKLSEGDFSTRVDIKRNDELGDLADAFNAVVPRLKDHLHVKENLDLAEQVQKNLLPKAAPDIPGYDIAGFSIYCDETGGDYYDFLYSDDPEDDRLGIVVGDVSGHGVASALLMATVRGAVWSLAKYETDLGEGVREINNQLVSTTSMGRFMTLFCVVINYKANALQWVNAGHEPAMVYSAVENTFEELGGKDIPLGIENNWSYQAHIMKHLPQGSIVVIGTDGIWETRNDKGEEFGRDAFRNAIQQNADKTAAGICEAIKTELSVFRGTAPQLDDVTLVVVRNECP